MLNPLLVQLFGREVVDRLEKAGLSTDEAVGRLGPEALCERAAIPPEVARRVIALASELSAPRTARPAKARPRAGRTRAGVQGGRPQLPAQADPIALSGRAAAPADPAVADEEPPTRDAPEAAALQHAQEQTIDAFVDEAGLIAWMGLAARAGTEASLIASVAEGILEPPPSRRPSPAPQHAGRSRGTTAVTIEGSFWHFGSRPHGGNIIAPAPAGAPSEGNPDTTNAPAGSALPRPVPFHRRRSHDGH
jgi:hypothetical protein